MTSWPYSTRSVNATGMFPPRVLDKEPETGDIKIGKKQYEVQHGYKGWDFLKQDQMSNRQAVFKPTQGIHETKFHKGFARRQQHTIGQDSARKEYESLKSARQEQCLTARREEATARGKASGYNFQTGEDNGANTTREGKKHVYYSMNVQAENDRRIKNTEYRYHVNPKENPTRSSQLTKEGFIGTKRESTTLGHGLGCPPSHRLESIGCRDNFLGRQGVHSPRGGATPREETPRTARSGRPTRSNVRAPQ